MSKENFQHLIALLSNDKIEEVVEILLSEYPNNEIIIQLSGNLQNVRGSTLRGEYSNDEIIRFRNQIRNSTINIINQIKEENTIITPRVVGYSDSVVRPISCLLSISIIGILSALLYSFLSKFELPTFVLPPYPKNIRDSIPKPIAAQKFEKTTISPFISEKKFSGNDESGKKAEYIIFIVRNFNWALGETSVSEKNGVQSEICEHLKEIGVETRLNREDYKGIICFGNTSVEEDQSLPKSLRTSNEEDRAEFRATFLALCVGEVLKSKTPIYKSNLGKYKTSDEITDYQREIMIVGILYNEEGVINEEALFNGLVDYHLIEDWEIDIRNYSKIQTDKVKIERYLN
jgi:hypothetical protein